MSQLLANSAAALREVLDRVDDAREDIAELCLVLGNTYGPFGYEAATATEVLRWYDRNGIPAKLVPISDERANVVGRLAGSGGGRSLLFNAHLDTEASGPDYDNLMACPDPNRIGARREGDRLYGQTVLNDRGCMALFMIAARAIRDAGAELRGDLLLTSVAGETGASPVDEFQGLRYDGKGLGSRFLVDHGVRADYALVAETTDFGLCWSNLGACYFKVTLRGQNVYTPRLTRPEGGLAGHPNAIVKAAPVVEAIEEWAIAREQELATQGPCGPVRPKAQVGAIRGGIPWRPNRSSTYCALYVDVRTLPGESPEDVMASLSRAVADVGVGATLELVMAKPGRTGTGYEPLADAIRSAHRQVRGQDPPAQVPVSVASMWRDTNVFNAAGIPAVTFGPSRGPAVAQGSGYFFLDDLVDAAKMYALIGLQIAGNQSAAAAQVQ